MFELMKSAPGRVVRVAVGFLIVLEAVTFPPLVALVLVVIGTVVAVTAMAGECYLEKLVRRA